EKTAHTSASGKRLCSSAVVSAALCPAPSTTNRDAADISSTLYSRSLLCHTRFDSTIPSGNEGIRPVATARLRAEYTSPALDRKGVGDGTGGGLLSHR